jgi:hypothetical protein
MATSRPVKKNEFRRRWAEAADCDAAFERAHGNSLLFRHTDISALAARLRATGRLTCGLAVHRGIGFVHRVAPLVTVLRESPLSEEDLLPRVCRDAPVADGDGLRELPGPPV